MCFRRRILGESKPTTYTITINCYDYEFQMPIGEGLYYETINAGETKYINPPYIEGYQISESWLAQNAMSIPIEVVGTGDITIDFVYEPASSGDYYIYLSYYFEGEDGSTDYLDSATLGPYPDGEQIYYGSDIPYTYGDFVYYTDSYGGECFIDGGDVYVDVYYRDPNGAYEL